MTRRQLHVIHHNDNVATALVDLRKGSKVRVERGSEEIDVRVRQSIPFGHKLAIDRIAKGQPIIKYGQVIGVATSKIKIGEHVHIHNMESRRGRGNLA